MASARGSLDAPKEDVIFLKDAADGKAKEDKAKPEAKKPDGTKVADKKAEDGLFEH